MGESCRIFASMSFNIPNKLPKVQQSIFSVMTMLANEEKAINMAQGFPEFQPPSELMDAVYKAMRDGFNQYPLMPGYMALRESIAKKEWECHRNTVNPDSEITVVPGATAGIFTVIQALVDKGDEVIILEPAYDSYEPAIQLAGGVCKRVSYNLETLRISWDEVRAAITNKTRAILVNTPHNPLGTIFTSDDWSQLASIIEGTQIIVISDEVYEHMVFDNQQHFSVWNREEFKNRCVKVSSFGKTYHSTGWKMGYVMACPEITTQIRKVYQFLAFSCHGPSQMGIHQFMQLDNSWENGVATMYETKRNFFQNALRGSRFKIMPCEGSYFQILKMEGLDFQSDLELAKGLTMTAKIASIPVSAFCDNREKTGLLRFCFAKNEDTLEKAAQILCSL